MERKAYIDNVRWITVVLVILYHVIYIFNSAGCISNFAVQGIPQMDAFLYFVYPWFMSLLFVVAGVGAKYSLQKRTGKEFIKDRAKRVLIPSIMGIFMLGWIGGWVSNQYTDMFGGNGANVPEIAKYLMYCLCGIGPLWFAHQLFLACLVLLLIRAIDKKDKLSQLGQKTGYIGFLLLAVAYWVSSMILNTPMIEVYRNSFYIFSFLLGYYVFSHDGVLERLKKIKQSLGIAAVIVGIVYTIYYFGENYTTQAVLQHPFTNVYAWIMILAILAWAKDALNFSNGVSRYMTKANFGLYVLHFPLLCAIAYMTQKYLQIPMLAHYIVNLVLLAVLLPIVYEILKRIPVIRRLILGI